jgi:hypothetical protein|tara:strand:+ start:291 stop:911 length:621 start_codon:yes stop_codon:yes gene_type:complete
MKVHTLYIDSNERDIGVYPNANNYVIHLENPIYDVSEIRLVSARIPTPQTTPIRPKSLILRLSSGSDEFNQSVYVSTPHYTGQILLNDTTAITFNGSDDPLVHRFHSGSQKIIKDLQFEFLYMNNGNLESYNFGSQEHILKFEIQCSTDKLEGTAKVPVPEVEKKEVTHISVPTIETAYEWKEYIYIMIIVLVGTLVLALMKRKPN